MKGKTEKIGLIGRHFVLIVMGIVFVFPLVWMILGSFKTNNQIWQEPFKLFPYTWDFGKVFVSMMEIDFSKYIFNSLYVGIVGSSLSILVAALFAYAVVFLKNKYTDIMFFVVLVTYMLPSAVTYVPSYVILARLDMLDRLYGLMFSNLASVFIVFYLRQSFMKMSYEYIEAAKVDGASHLQILRHVVFPLNKSAFITIGVLTFVQNYNNYMWPSIMLNSDEKLLVSQGLRQFFIQGGAYGMNWSEVMLTSTMTVLPILIIFIIGQRWFTTGIMEDSGIK